MTDRNNEARLGSTDERADLSKETEKETTTNNSPLSFAAPTEMVDLPSGGKYYPEGHPLHGVDSVEIKFMTAKEEDILTSRSLLKKGVALDRLLESVIVSPKVSPRDMLIGDKNALLVAARVTGYGSDYETNVNCPACGERSTFSFDLEQKKIKGGDETEQAVRTDNGTWKIKLPLSKWEVEVRLLTGHDEKKLLDLMEMKRKNGVDENTVTEQFKLLIVSVQGETDRQTVEKAIGVMPASDARHLRSVYADVAPAVDLTQHFVCDKCGTETKMEVPFNTDFFWTK